MSALNRNIMHLPLAPSLPTHPLPRSLPTPLSPPCPSPHTRYYNFYLDMMSLLDPPSTLAPTLPLSLLRCITVCPIPYTLHVQGLWECRRTCTNSLCLSLSLSRARALSLSLARSLSLSDAHAHTAPDLGAIPHVQWLQWLGTLVTAIIQNILETVGDRVPMARSAILWCVHTKTKKNAIL